MVSESTLSFDDIPESAITQAEEYLRQLLKEEFPSMDLTENRVIYENVIRPAAIVHAINRADIDTLKQSFSPLVIAENPDLADEDMTDAVFANYGITRFEGSKATGLVAIIISELATTAVPANSVFTANGLNFVVSQAYVGVTTADAVLGTGERLIEERTDGSYVFTVPVTAEETGSTYQMKRNSRFTVSPTIAGVIDITAAQDFEGGTSAETNAELVQRAQSGIAPKVFSGRAQIEALIRDEVDDIQAVSQVGFGDSEMLRDRHNIFELSTGGKADLYVRTAPVPDELKVTKSCSYLGSNLWTATIGRNDAPGFYLISAVVQKGETAFDGSLEIQTEVRGYDLTPDQDEFVQTIENIQEAAYTRYQTAVITFEDPSTDPTTLIGATAEYDIYVLRMINIQAVHNLTVDRSKRPPTGDYLVKAPVPALTAVSMQVQRRTTTASFDISAMKQAVASRANSIGFNTGKLFMALLVDAAMGLVEPYGSAVVTPIEMHAYIYPPDTVPTGRIELRDPNLLEIPDLPERGVSQRTTCFYLDEDDVSIAEVPMATKQI